jgi:hypothetical protein
LSQTVVSRTLGEYRLREDEELLFISNVPW